MQLNDKIRNLKGKQVKMSWRSKTMTLLWFGKWAWKLSICKAVDDREM